MRWPVPARLRSFRIRIAVLSTTLSALALAGFMTWAWLMVQRIDLHSMDEDIRQIGYRTLSMPQGPRPWSELAESLNSIRGANGDEDSIVLRVQNREGRLLFASPEWPAELDALDLSAILPAAPTDTALESTPSDPEPPDAILRTDRGPDPGGGQRPMELSPFDDRGRPRGDDGHRPRFRAFGPPRRPLPVSIAEPFTQHAGGREWRLGVMRNPEVTFVLGLNMSRFNFELRRLRDAFLVAAPAVLALIAVAGWLVSQRALRPVRTLTATAERITAKGLDQRIPVTEEDIEFERLVTVFNRMMDRLEGSFQQAVRFSADAAHELKTPLTILQGVLEQAIQEAPADSQQQRVLGELQDEVQRLKNIIRKLLLLSLADSGQLKLNPERVNLSEILDDACEDIGILAPQLTITRSIAPDQWVMADPDLIRQLIQNLISNAIKYNREDGFIRVELGAERSVLRLQVGNSGPGIPPEDRARVFDRFYRGDKSRNRSQEGVGLGLSLAREIARVHQGDIILENSAPGETVFTLILPAAAPA